MNQTDLHIGRAAALFVAAWFAASSVVAATTAAGSGRSGIAWHNASSDADVDKAFALARQSGKPVYLYWGAVWCPPCNQVKATLFSRQDFVERSRAFIPVYVDGDKPGAQKVAARFKVSGYPSMVMFKPDGSEITRLPGEVDPQRYLLTLTAALNAQVPVKDLVQRGLTGQPLSSEQWRMLAYYSWDTDEQQVLKSSELAKRLSELAAAVPPELAGVRDRIAFKAMLARARSTSPSEPGLVAADRKLIDRVLFEADSSGEMADLLLAYSETAVAYAAPQGTERSSLARKWDAVAGKLMDAGNLSRSDFVDALDGRIALWKFMEGKELSESRRGQVVRELSRVVAQTTDRYERQAVIPSVAHVLAEAGLGAESDSLLKAELPRAVAPYYHMLGLAGNAKKRGEAQLALHWYEQAWRKAEGPATRIQWGVGYVGQIIELTPTDSEKVSSAALAVVSGLEARNETFFERNQRSLQRMAKRLGDWQGTDAARSQVVGKVKERLAKTCAKLPAKEPGRANCEGVFSSGATAS